MKTTHSSFECTLIRTDSHGHEYDCNISVDYTYTAGCASTQVDPTDDGDVEITAITDNATHKRFYPTPNELDDIMHDAYCHATED